MAKPKLFSLSKDEVAVFGIKSAGWDELTKFRGKKQAVHRYTAQYDSIDSAYNSHHIDKGRDQSGSYDDFEGDLHKSKALLVNTLQENIRRYYKGEDLIPIEMVIQSHLFKPDMERLKTKSHSGISDAEIRMIYKLMVEYPDPEINMIMRATVSFEEMNENGDFLTIANPWDEVSLHGKIEKEARQRNHS